MGDGDDKPLPPPHCILCRGALSVLELDYTIFWQSEENFEQSESVLKYMSECECVREKERGEGMERQRI